MENTTYIALSRQAALWRQLESVANNMANANTPGYKSEQMMFVDHLEKTKASDSALGGKIAFVRDVGMVRDTREGPLSTTGNPLDVAIHGEGYFAVETPAGINYTRAGHFRLDENGMLVTTEGFAVMQEGDLPVIFAPNESQIEIARDGTIATENGVIGKLRVVSFENEQELRKAGNSLYETTAEANDLERPVLAQGMLEQSNVVAIAEMTNMIALTRNYQGVQKILESEHERQLKVINTLGRPSQS